MLDPKIKDIPEPFRARAIELRKAEFEKNLVTKNTLEYFYTLDPLEEKLASAFIWSKSPEGFDFWNNIYNEAKLNK